LVCTEHKETTIKGGSDIAGEYHDSASYDRDVAA